MAVGEWRVWVLAGEPRASDSTVQLAASAIRNPVIIKFRNFKFTARLTVSAELDLTEKQ
jgi:hypothetical protein